jgi:DNA helicase-4
VPSHSPAGVDLTFRTVHSSKGLEADYIVISRLSAGTYGFPSGIADDPLLDIVMAAPDDYPHAEERRLLYVALTRARREVLVITEIGRESPFAIELIKDGLAVAAGEECQPQVCPVCERGFMTARTGRWGQFLGCSRFPACRATEKIA